MIGIKKALHRLENALDRFFACPAVALRGLLRTIFEYDYLETKDGVFGIFASPRDLRRAARAARDRGFTDFDCFTPFPVHGLADDMGLGRSRLGYLTFFAGLIGLVAGFLMQYIAHEQVIHTTLSRGLDAYPNLNSYPLNLGGRPNFSWPEMVPVCFELTVLFGGVFTFIGLLLLARLPKISRVPLHPRITRDGFCLWIPASSKSFSEEGVTDFLSEMGATDITRVQ